MDHNPTRILLADDDIDDRMIFEEAFAAIRAKTSLSLFEDGAALMEYLGDERNPLPDMLFLDLNMPRKNGFQCLKEIRGNARLREISIAIYSTSSLDSDREKAFVLGANIYIVKPADYDGLIKKLAKVLSVNWQYVTSGLDREVFLLSV